MNGRGLDDRNKRSDVINWLKQKMSDIYILQETHTSQQSTQVWENEWGYKGIFSSHTSKSRGVAILFRNTFEFKINKTIIHDEGRYVIVDITISNTRLTLVALYGPNDDTPNFFSLLQAQIETIANSSKIIVGDWNVVQDYDKDTKNYKGKNNPKSKQ